MVRPNKTPSTAKSADNRYDSQSLSLPKNTTAGMRLSQMTRVNPGSDKDGSDKDSEDEFIMWHANSGPTTPNILETAAQLRRTLSVSVLQDLAQMPPTQLGKSVGSKFWRPHDEEARIPGDWERLLVHVVRGGLRAGNLAFGLRATVMLVFALIKAIRSKRFRSKEFGLAVFGPTNFRFAGMFALWAMLYKTTHNSLRLLTPRPVRKSRSRTNTYGEGQASNLIANSNTTPQETPAESGAGTPNLGAEAFQGKSTVDIAKLKAKQKKRAFMRDPRSKVWHAYVAGAISALAVLLETPANRITLAQQLFVRGLEGTYNLAHGKGLVHVPHGSVLIFGLACGQIMQSWLESPEQLPQSYGNWITRASQVSPFASPLYRDVRFHQQADLDAVLKYFPDGKIPQPYSTHPLRYPHIPANKVNRRGIHGKNVKQIAEWVDSAKKGKVGDVISCALVHPWQPSHLWSPIDRFFEVTRWILPVYLTLHFVPAMFLRTGAFLRDPARTFVRSLLGAVRSSSFLGVFVVIFQTIFCAAHSSYNYIQSTPSVGKRMPNWVLRMLLSSQLKWIAGFCTCLSLFVEHPKRRAELAAYVLPKGMESAWSNARKRAWVPFLPGGDLVFTSISMSLVMGTYAQNPEHLSGLVRRVVYQFVGRN